MENDRPVRIHYKEAIKSYACCIHLKQPHRCKICNPVHCDVCGKTYSKSYYYEQHIKTDKHIKKWKRTI